MSSPNIPSASSEKLQELNQAPQTGNTFTEHLVLSEFELMVAQLNEEGKLPENLNGFNTGEMLAKINQRNRIDAKFFDAMNAVKEFAGNRLSILHDVVQAHVDTTRNHVQQTIQQA